MQPFRKTKHIARPRWDVNINFAAQPYFFAGQSLQVTLLQTNFLADGLQKPTRTRALTNFTIFRLYISFDSQKMGRKSLAPDSLYLEAVTPQEFRRGTRKSSMRELFS
jgi:hypothetical protein